MASLGTAPNAQIIKLRQIGGLHAVLPHREDIQGRPPDLQGMGSDVDPKSSKGEKRMAELNYDIESQSYVRVSQVSN